MRRHSRSLIELIQKYTPEPKYGAEIGVYKGENSAHLLTAFPGLCLYMIDPWAEWSEDSTYYDKHQAISRKTEEEWELIYQEAMGRVVAVSENYAVFRCVGNKAVNIIGDPLDFVFLDASHLYEDVLNDIKLWTPKVRNGGLIAGHDYGGMMDNKGEWGVSKAVHEIFGKDRVITKQGLVWAVIKEEKDNR